MTQEYDRDPQKDRDDTESLIASARLFVDRLPNSREKSLVLTKLDEACHWLKDIQITA